MQNFLDYLYIRGFEKSLIKYVDKFVLILRCGVIMAKIKIALRNELSSYAGGLLTF